MRGESPLMSDLNWYIMNKDHDPAVIMGAMGQVNQGKQHLIGMNPPPAQQDIDVNKYSKSRERPSLNPSQLLINLQNYNFKQQN